MSNSREMKPCSIPVIVAVLSLFIPAAQAVPDLEVVGTPIVHQKPYYCGGPLTVTYTVRNKGDQAAGPSSTRVQVFPPESTQFASMEFPIAGLAVGAQRTETHTIPSMGTNGASGEWEAAVRLDTFFDIDDEYPTVNNVATPAKFLTIATKWDLRFLNDANPGPTPVPNAYGQKMQLAFYIHNYSSAPAPATKTRVQIYDRNHSTVVNDDVDTPAIPPLGKVPFVYSYQLPATGTPGNWYVFVNLNDYFAQGEASGFNNAADEIPFMVAAAGTPTQPAELTPALVNARLSGNNMLFELYGNPGSTLNIQTSTDLNTWSPLTSQVMNNGVNTLSTPRNGPKRYYRVK